MWKGSRLDQSYTRLDKKVVKSDGERCHEIGTFLMLLPKLSYLVA